MVCESPWPLQSSPPQQPSWLLHQRWRTEAALDSSAIARPFGLTSARTGSAHQRQWTSWERKLPNNHAGFGDDWTSSIATRSRTSIDPLDMCTARWRYHRPFACGTRLDSHAGGRARVSHGTRRGVVCHWQRFGLRLWRCGGETKSVCARKPTPQGYADSVGGSFWTHRGTGDSTSGRYSREAHSLVALAQRCATNSCAAGVLT